jgi:hypothetical protein
MKIFATALIVLLAGSGELPQNPTASNSVNCRHPDIESADNNGIGDSAITQGLLFQSDSAYEFRLCNKEEIYLVDGSFAVLEKLDQYFSTRSTNTLRPTYVRFRGTEIECGDSLPDRYENAVEITELLTQNSAPPTGCN